MPSSFDVQIITLLSADPEAKRLPESVFKKKINFTCLQAGILQTVLLLQPFVSVLVAALWSQEVWVHFQFCLKLTEMYGGPAASQHHVLCSELSHD